MANLSEVFGGAAAIAKGMSVTFKEMLNPTLTEDYPEAPAKFQERFRGVHELQRDENGLEKCVACFLCAAACPADCIYIEAAENTDVLRISGGERYAKVYNIDYNRCIFCGFCVEACPTDAITHGHGFEIASYNTSTLIYRKEQMLVPIPAGAHFPLKADTSPSGGGHELPRLQVMVQPTTQLSVLLLLVLSLFCWGSWINTFKLTRSWRFEYFYYDFTLGMLLAAVIAAFTLGSLDPQELTFQDNLLLAAYRKIALAAGSGIVLNLGNLFLLAAVAVSGMSVAFPIAFGTALLIGAIVSYASHPQMSIALISGGVVLLVTAILGNIMAHVWRLDEKAAAAVKPLQVDPRSKLAPPAATGAMRGIILSLVGGLLLGAFFPMIDDATAGDRGVASYAAAILIAGGVAASSLFYIPFFLAFPVLGVPGQVRGYFKGEKKQHVWGVLGGILGMVGIVAGLLADGVAPPMQPGQVAQYLLTHAAFLVAAIWGIVAWREFRGASYKVNMILAATLVLFLAGLGMVAVAPLYGG